MIERRLGLLALRLLGLQRGERVRPLPEQVLDALHHEGHRRR
jgi:hypothetical protein